MIKMIIINNLNNILKKNRENIIIHFLMQIILFNGKKIKQILLKKIWNLTINYGLNRYYNIIKLKRELFTVNL